MSLQLLGGKLGISIWIPTEKVFQSFWECISIPPPAGDGLIQDLDGVPTKSTPKVWGTFHVLWNRMQDFQGSGKHGGRKECSNPGGLVLDGDPPKIGAQSVGFGKAVAVGQDLEREDP